MASQRNTGAFVAGSVLGGLIGAAAVLWKTPKSGAELRGGFSGERQGAVTYRAGEGATVQEERRFSNPVLSFVEKAAAPIVGVELGRLAKDDPNAVTTAPVRTSSADAKPPSFETRPVAGTAAARASGYEPTATETAFAAQSAEEEVTHDPVEGSHAHAATSEELTSPIPEYVEQRAESAGAEPTTAKAAFPDLPSRDTGQA